MYNACVYNAFVLYMLSITARNKTRATSLRRPFCSRNIRPKFKMTVPQRGADVSYILIQLVLLYLKNLLSYTA